MSSVISIIVPSRNEEKNIKECLEALEEYVPISKIIVVDRSEDSTPQIVKELADKYGNIELVETKKPGKGAGLKIGFQKAEGIVVMTDADNSYPAKDILKMLALLENADIVIGSRYCKQGRLIGVPFSRQFLGKGYSLLSRVFIGVHDTQSGLKAFRKQVLDKVGRIDEDGFGWDTVFVARAKRNGLRVVEHPIEYTAKEKPSNVSAVKTTWQMWWNFVQVVFRLK